MAALRSSVTRDSPPISLSSSEGMRRLARSLGDFAGLANFFAFQTDRYSCGRTSAAIVLNALRFGTERAPLLDEGLRGYTPDDFPTPPVRGLRLAELTTLLSAYGVHAQVHRAHDEHGKTKAALRRVFANSHYVIANYYRPALGQEGLGHFSPLGAFDPLSQSYLILDVNPSVSPWIWVSEEHLFEAMRVKDLGQPRGFIVVREYPRR